MHVPVRLPPKVGEDEGTVRGYFPPIKCKFAFYANPAFVPTTLLWELNYMNSKSPHTVQYTVPQILYHVILFVLKKLRNGTFLGPYLLHLKFSDNCI